MVYVFDDDTEKVFTITPNKYQAGQGTATLQIRGSADTYFEVDDNVIAWQNYTGTFHEDWKYVQIRVIKTV